MTLAAAAAPATKRMTAIPPDAKDVPAKLYDEVLVAGADGQPRLYKIHREAKRVIGDDLNRVREYEKFPGRVYAVAFDKTGKYFAAGSSLDGVGEARVYDADSRQARLDVRSGEDAGVRGRVPTGRQGGGDRGLRRHRAAERRDVRGSW